MRNAEATRLEQLTAVADLPDYHARTKEGCPAQIKNGLGINITLAAATVSFPATHS